MSSRRSISMTLILTVATVSISLLQCHLAAVSHQIYCDTVNFNCSVNFIVALC